MKRTILASKALILIGRLNQKKREIQFLHDFIVKYVDLINFEVKKIMSE